MSQHRRRRNEASDRACLECQRRKTKCTFREGTEICTYCIKSGKNCVFSEKFPRKPLTRKNLDAAESRCKELESLLVSLRSKPEDQRDSQSQLPPRSAPEAISDGIAIQKPTSGIRESSAHVAVGSYEWQEERMLETNGQGEECHDGMAATQRRSGGYFGFSSASALLESLSSTLSPGGDDTSPAITSVRSSIQYVPQNPGIQPGLIYSSGITSDLIRDHFINIYFVAYNSSYPIIHERTFRNRLLKHGQIPSHSIFHSISYMVLAIGEWITGNASDHHSVYYEAARSRLNLEILETGNIMVVQAFLLLGNYLQKRDRPNTAYNFIGIAHRAALGLGLHCETPSSRESNTFLTQQRRQLFWTLYCFDSGFSLTTGRPTLISDSFIDVKKPMNFDDSLDDADGSEVQEVDYPTTCSAIIAQAKLAVIANKVINNLLSSRSCHDVNDFTGTMEQSMNNWRSSLPVYFFQENIPQWFLGPRQIVFWKEANLRITLLLASQRHALEDEDKVVVGARCQSVAVSTISDIAEFCEHYIELMHVGMSWYAVYFLLHALLALAFQRSAEDKRGGLRILIQERESARSAWESASLRARQCLEALSCSNHAAIRTLQILDRLQESFVTNAQTNDTNADPQATENVYHHIPPEDTASGPFQFIANRVKPFVDNQHHNPMAPAQNQGVPPEVVPLADHATNEWLGAAGASLHISFNDETAGLDGASVFQGFQGFSSEIEPENLTDTANMMQGMRDMP